jgi:DNA-binding transcriptional regulator LsrR (DeoR family)
MRRKTLQSDIARALGISRQRVHVLMNRGMPVDSVDAARAWRAEHMDADLMKPDPRGTAAPVNPQLAELKLRLLAAEVELKEEKARNAGGVTLPYMRVEQGLQTGLQLLRASIGGAKSDLFAEVTQKIGTAAARDVLSVVERFWDGVHDVACDAILQGFQRELPLWGRDFRNRWVRVKRGNFPDRAYPGEPRLLDEDG